MSQKFLYDLFNVDVRAAPSNHLWNWGFQQITLPETKANKYNMLLSVLGIYRDSSPGVQQIYFLNGTAAVFGP